MSRTLSALALTVLLVVSLVACSSEDSDSPASDSPFGTPASDSPFGTPTETPTETPSVGPVDPVRFPDVERGCTEVQGDLLVVEQFRVGRRITVTALRPARVTGRIDAGRVTYVRKPAGEITHTGAWLGTAPEPKYWDRLGWRDRQPINGAGLDEGWYYAFVPMSITQPSAYHGLALTWTDEAGRGTSRSASVNRFRAHC